MAYQPHQQQNRYVNQNNAHDRQVSHEESGRNEIGQSMSYAYDSAPIMHHSHARQGYNALPNTRPTHQNQQWPNEHIHQSFSHFQHQQFADHPQQTQWSHMHPSEHQSYHQHMSQQQRQPAHAWQYQMSQSATAHDGYAFQHSTPQSSSLPSHAEQQNVNMSPNFNNFHHNHLHASQPITTNTAGHASSNGIAQGQHRHHAGQYNGRGYHEAVQGQNSQSNTWSAHETNAKAAPMAPMLGQKHFPQSTSVEIPASTHRDRLISANKHNSAAGGMQEPVSAHKHITSSAENHNPSSTNKYAPLTAKKHDTIHLPKHNSVSAIKHDTELHEVIHVSPKRRKSNEGVAVPVPRQQQPSAVLQPTKSEKRTLPSGPLPQQSSKEHAQVPLPDQDLSQVLLALSEEYVNAAHSMGPALADGTASDDDLRQYQRLIATAISCLDSVLQNFRFPDQRRTAMIQLRLATLLYEETNNTDKADEILSKGIAMCDSHKLYDLKYAMQHIYIRNLHKNNSKAALKALNKTITESEVLKLSHWQYAFNLLIVSLYMDSGSSSSLAAAHKHLRSLISLADSLGDTSVKIVCSALQAICHFRGGTSDDISSAAYSMAVANASQLSDELLDMPQARALINCLNMISSVPRFSSEAMFTAMRQMHPEQNTLSKAGGWSKDGSFAIPLVAKPTLHAVLDSFGVLAELKGRLALNARWMTSAEMMILCYMLSGIGSIPKNGERLEAERFFTQAAKINDLRLQKVNGSLHTLMQEDVRRKRVADSIQYMLACALASRAQYAEALKVVGELEPTFTAAPRSWMRERLCFVRGICEQGLGHLEAALKLLHIDVAHLQPEARLPPMLKDLCILSGLNSIHIMDQLQRPRSEIEALLDLLESHCLDHVNRNFAAAYHVVVATIGFNTSTIIETKNRLSHALQPAQAAKNQQLLAIIMNMMTEIFFTDIVGAQAQKSAHAAHTLAAKSGDSLWTAVGLGMYRETLDRMGETEKASEMDVPMRKAILGVPHDVQRALNLL